ncbi:Bacterial alpha-L-rhamnosidase [Cohnella sp. CFH 77786]|uniref:glycoside hydrolase family 78 protein n=1 Tax=Cohnella sp. CFH 77786 TaxID=2662265 RepID=UPI001C60FAA4|nr:glycoside hydrolase family 78 protein [Cohnella sp. CFH 77786]MBW5447732.1 Bacterial alpha-L-rhamnosidase [Cohnella sp. CFH 77786]
MFRVTGLSCEYKINPVGIDVARPRIGWRLEADERAAVQTACRIQVADDPLFQRIVWDSGKVASDRSVHVELGDFASPSRKRFHYRVMAWNGQDRPSGWSEPGYWETGLLDASEWSASWISPPAELSSRDPDRCPMLRKSFRVDGRIREARMYATALGLYELTLNGIRVGDRYFTPGWTSYRQRLQYQTYDVTSLLRKGENVVGCMLGKGWYKGEIGWEGESGKYGDRLALLLQMHITLEDGTEWTLETDGTWKAAPSPILMSEIYHGETYDARLEQPGWNAPGFDDGSWSFAEIIEHPKSILTAQENEPVQAVESIAPIALITTPEGDSVLDFGQNMVGWVRFAVSGESGDEVTLQHAEVLDQDGNFYTDNLRKAKQTVRYALRGGGRETFEPHFTFQGFRYVRLTGFRAPISLDDFEGIVLHSHMNPTGRFECSDPMINQLQHNILWGLKGNFLDVPTDCPQRDERLGWTGDAQMFIRTAAYLVNVNPFFTKWLRDLKADQAPDGGVPFVVPHVLKPTSHSSAAWGDAAVICPWTLYLVYGDTRILEEQYDSMKAWVEYIRRSGDDECLWNTGFHFGDWLGLDAKPDSYIGATDKDYIATAFYAHSVSLLQKTAAVLNEQADAEAYSVLRDRIQDAFEREFVTPSGRLSVPTQTAQVLGLTFGLLRGKAKERAVRKLTELLEESKFHLTTGFVGTPYLNHALSENGLTEAAYKLLFQQDYPSWLYQVTKGATTIWEHWDGIREDGSFWSRDMNSFNHYAYGAIGDWLYRCVAGIDTDESCPGYKKIRIRPQPPAQGLDWADGRLDTMYGTVRSAWRRREDGKMELQATIPPNTTAEIRLPGAAAATATESGKPIRSAAGISSAWESGCDLILAAGSGSYEFVW